MMEFQEAIVETVSAGFPFEFVMNLPYTSFLSLQDTLHRVRAKRNIALLYRLVAPQGDGKLIEQLFEEDTTAIASYTSDAVSDEVNKEVESFNAYLGGLT